MFLLLAAAALLPVSIALAADPSTPAADGTALGLARRHRRDRSRPATRTSPVMGSRSPMSRRRPIYVVPATGGPPRAVTSAGSTASIPVLVTGRPHALLPVRPGRIEPALEAAGRAAFGEAMQVTTVRARHRLAQSSPDESQLLLRFTRVGPAGAGRQGSREAARRKSPSPGSSRGSNSRKTPATAISRAIARSTCTRSISNPES